MTFLKSLGLAFWWAMGLTETAPVTNVRRPWRNLRGSSGPPIAGTEIRIVDPETRQPLPQGKRGLVLIRGDQVMQGYYGNPDATARKRSTPIGGSTVAILGWVTTENDLVLTGRAKDTIVLTNGENIEPQPIEDACLRSPYIDQIMLVGQDQKVGGRTDCPQPGGFAAGVRARNRARFDQQAGSRSVSARTQPRSAKSPRLPGRRSNRHPAADCRTLHRSKTAC